MPAIKAKTIITKSKLPNVAYCFNPYVGCTIGCVYCYARFMSRFTGHSDKKWGSYLDWKINALELLEKELPKIKKTGGGAVLLGSVTDCYQPAERKLKLTRQSLKVFLKHQIPISILTKNDLAKRDFDLLNQFEDCEFGVSISILDAKTAKILEPHTSLPENRISLLQEAYKIGLKTYAFIGPLHPIISDLTIIFNKVAPYVYCVMGEIPNLKCGNWLDVQTALRKLDICSDVYKQIAESERFYQENKVNLIQLCKKANIQFGGFFKH